MKGGWPNNFTRGMTAGVLATLLIALLMGAVHNDRPVLTVPVPEPAEDPVLAPISGSGSGVAPHAGSFSSPGRYQIATWEAGGGYGAFVLDTATGTTKVAYSSIKGPNGKSVNNLGKPFSQM